MMPCWHDVYACHAFVISCARAFLRWDFHRWTACGTTTGGVPPPLISTGMGGGGRVPPTTARTSPCSSNPGEQITNYKQILNRSLFCKKTVPQIVIADVFCIPAPALAGCNTRRGSKKKKKKGGINPVAFLIVSSDRPCRGP